MENRPPIIVRRGELARLSRHVTSMGGQAMRDEGAIE